MDNISKVLSGVVEQLWLYVILFSMEGEEN